MLTIKQVAEKLGVHKITVYRWIYQKKLKAYKISRNIVRIEEEELEKFLEKKRTKKDQTTKLQ